ncbi:MAG: hypothetical protein LBK73_06330 [Treponema sp.]|nr:hypothetical protein [Treponema sp.]
MEKVFVAIGRKSDSTHEAPTPNALTTVNVLTMPPPATGKNRNGSTPAIVALVVEKSAHRSMSTNLVQNQHCGVYRDEGCGESGAKKSPPW